jgi:hypothetical protein
LVPHNKSHNGLDLETVRVFPVILAPCHLLREPDEIWTGNVVMVPDLGSAPPGKEALRVIGISPIERIGFLVIDPLHDQAAMQ